MFEDEMDEADHRREVYVFFGLAVYHAQVLEAGLMNALVVFDFIPKNFGHIEEKTDWSDKFDSFFEGSAALTMGNLIRALRKVTPIPDDLEGQLKSALDERKFLVHHYFREKITQFATKEGRNAMIEDFNRCIKVFVAADRRIDSIMFPLLSRFGMTREKIEALVQEQKAAIQAAAAG